MIFNSNNVSVQTDFIDYTANKKVGLYEEKCLEIAKKSGINGAEVDIYYKISSKGDLNIENVIINLQNSEFITDKAHIDIIDELKMSVAKYLNVRTDLVVFYEWFGKKFKPIVKHYQ